MDHNPEDVGSKPTAGNNQRFFTCFYKWLYAINENSSKKSVRNITHFTYLMPVVTVYPEHDKRVY